MNNIFFCDEFVFCRYSFRACHHADNTMGLRLHYFARIKKGTVRIVTSDREEYFFNEGDVFYLPRGCRYHSYWRGIPGSDNCVEWESYGFEVFPSSVNISYGIQKIDVCNEQKKYMDEISRDMKITPKNAGLLYLFLNESVKNMEIAAPDFKTGILEKARKYIEENNELRVCELARYCNMSESGLYNFFRENLKTTPVGFKNQIKVNKAINMLQFTSASVEEISTALGFANAAYFRKIFKSHTGTTPIKIRKDAKHI